MTSVAQATQQVSLAAYSRLQTIFCTAAAITAATELQFLGPALYMSSAANVKLQMSCHAAAAAVVVAAGLPS